MKKPSYYLYRILRRLLRIITNRLVLIVFFLLVQICVFLLLFLQITSYAKWIRTGLILLSVLIELFILYQDGNPSYKILWLLFIGAFPIFGGLLYLLFGNKFPSRKMRRQLARGRQYIGRYREMHSSAQEVHIPASRFIEKNGYPPYENTKVSYFDSGAKAFEVLKEDLAGAKHFIFMEYFILAEGQMWNSILEILIQKAAQGVEVRLIYDDLGSIGRNDPGLVRRLEEKGIHALCFNRFRPRLDVVMNNRDHRKYTVIDGIIAHTGGYNIADEYVGITRRFGEWKDAGLRLEGEGVYTFTTLHLQLWNAFKVTDDHSDDFRPSCYPPVLSEGYVQPYANSPFEKETLAADVLNELLAGAKSYLYIFTPYLALDDELLHAMRRAASRGVDIRIVIPGIPDKKTIYSLSRSYYPTLLQNGIRIYEYTPGFLHAKNLLCDDCIGVVGTINLDYRSLFLHMENAVFLYRSAALRALRTDFRQTFSASHEVTLSDCKKHRRNLLWQAILRSISPLL